MGYYEVVCGFFLLTNSSPDNIWLAFFDRNILGTIAKTSKSVNEIENNIVLFIPNLQLQLKAKDHIISLISESAANKLFERLILNRITYKPRYSEHYSSELV